MELLLFYIFAALIGSLSADHPYLRLVNGPNRCAGRVEIFEKNIWGTICDDEWDMMDAVVVCRELKCGRALRAPVEATFGEGVGKIWLESINCKGTESSLRKCHHPAFGKHNCRHNEDASVVCSGISEDNEQLETEFLEATTVTILQAEEVFVHNAQTNINPTRKMATTAPPYEVGSVRLVNGGGPCAGRVEVFFNNTWGTVCDDHWNIRNAHVVCKQLNCGVAITATEKSLFGAGKGDIWLDDVKCSGPEETLMDCDSSTWGKHDCKHDEDAGVVCSEHMKRVPLLPAEDIVTSTVFPTLPDAVSEPTKRVPLPPDEDMFTSPVLPTLPGELSEQTKRVPLPPDEDMVTSPVLPTLPGSSVTESGLLDDTTMADPKTFGSSVSESGLLDDTTIAGPSIYVTKVGNVRLVNGERPCSGRVEVFYGGFWGTVCDNNWNIKNAHVVCKQLNCGLPISARGNAFFGKGTGNIWLDDVQCEGDEKSLEDCAASPKGQHNCLHNDDAGVVCQGELEDTSPASSEDQATVPIPSTIKDSSTFLENDETVIQNATERSELLKNTTVMAPKKYVTTVENVRLVNGERPCSGRVEVFYSGFWGTVCDNNWNIKNAHVVCKQLNCGLPISARGNAFFGKGTGNIWLDDVQCEGNEKYLEDCAASPRGQHNCIHNHDAGVVCQGHLEEITPKPSEDSVTLPIPSVMESSSTFVDSGETVSRNVTEKAELLKNMTTAPKTYVTTAGNIRLVNGERPCAGRVEVFFNNTWGTVCSDHWNMRNAHVVCKQLNCGLPTSAPVKGFYGLGTGNIWLDDVACKGDEPSLENCDALPWGKHNCKHNDDAGVVCSGYPLGTPPLSSENGSTSTTPVFDGKTEQKINRTVGPKTYVTQSRNVRLVDGERPCSGRVEIFYKNAWGTVCDDLWNIRNAYVVCRQLNCGLPISAPGNAFFGEGKGNIWMDDVKCNGDEKSLESCTASSRGAHNCNHNEDAGVVCSGSSIFVDSGETVSKNVTEKAELLKNMTTAPKTYVTTAGNIRLVNGERPCAGRVEVFFNNIWGTVCDDHWNMRNAHVVCKQLNCGLPISAPIKGFYGLGTGNIWLDDVECKGDEPSLDYCDALPWGKHNCKHNDDAGVVCSGYPLGTPPLSSEDGTTSTTDVLDRNTEQKINRTVGPKTYVTQSRNVRLVDGERPCSGRVEIFYKNAWGTVCDDLWNIRNAYVVCRQLNCGLPISAPGNAFFGEGKGNIWMDDVKCNGDEKSLEYCTASPRGAHNCNHNEDAGVVCSGSSIFVDSGETVSKNVTEKSELLQNMTTAPKTYVTTAGNIRLVNGERPCAGRVEVFFNNTWGTVCDDHWNIKNAHVVCKQLNCGLPISAPVKGFYGLGTGNIWLDDVECKGDEPSLDYCDALPWGKHNCKHNDDAGVVCSGYPLGTPPLSSENGPTSTTNVDRNTEQKINTTVGPKTYVTQSRNVRLVDGERHCSGRVEIFYKNTWGTVCDDLWNIRNAYVVCRQLNCGLPISAPGNAFFGEGKGSIWMDDVKCNGDEKSLESCTASSRGAHNCNHNEDAGVVCSGSSIFLDSGETISENVTEEAELLKNMTTAPETYVTTAGNIRLVNGERPCAGRVEVFFNNTWGTVCDDHWNIKNAHVVCKQLNCGLPISAPVKGFYGLGTGNIWLDDVECKGDEPSLENCDALPWGKHNCKHNEDAGVVCSGYPLGTPPLSSENATSSTTPVLDRNTEQKINRTAGPKTYVTQSRNVRLVDGERPCSGRVEIFYKNAWGTVCDDLWNIRNAYVVCRQLNCGLPISAPGNAFFGEGKGNIWMDDVKCNGDEKSLESCTASSRGAHNCNHNEDAGVVCSGSSIFVDSGETVSKNVTENAELLRNMTTAPKTYVTTAGTIRLVNGERPCAGRVEVFFNNTWGTVCDDHWNIRNAHVVCKQLNCGLPISAPVKGFYGLGTGNIWLDDVECKGDEPSLENCDALPWGKHNCKHNEDAGVVCSGYSQGTPPSSSKHDTTPTTPVLDRESAACNNCTKVDTGHGNFAFSCQPEGGHVKLDCTSKVQVITCESHPNPEIIQILKGMKEDFNAFSSVYQQEKKELQSIANSLGLLTTSVNQLITAVERMLYLRDTGPDSYLKRADLK
ncbi:scavenger receptor cysteine-rich domain-containing protein DMBT1-like isoform 2-T2 [Discoglossus pictus]